MLCVCLFSQLEQHMDVLRGHGVTVGAKVFASGHVNHLRNNPEESAEAVLALVTQGTVHHK